MSAIKGDIL